MEQKCVFNIYNISKMDFNVMSNCWTVKHWVDYQAFRGHNDVDYISQPVRISRIFIYLCVVLGYNLDLIKKTLVNPVLKCVSS